MAHMGGSASAEIDAPLDEVWAVVEDVLSAPDWQGGVVGMEALETDAEGRATLVETENDIKVRREDQGALRLRRPDEPSWTQEKATSSRSRARGRSRTSAAAARRRPTSSTATRAACWA